MSELSITSQARPLISPELAPIREELRQLYEKAASGLRLKLGNGTVVAIFRQCYVAGTRVHIPFTGGNDVDVAETVRHMQNDFGPSAAIVFRLQNGTHTFSFAVDHLFTPDSNNNNNNNVATAYATASPPFNCRLFVVIVFWIVALSVLLVALRSSASPQPSPPASPMRHYAR